MRGDFDSLNIRENTSLLFSLLAALFSARALSNAVNRYRRPAYSLAHFALGLLAYGKGQHGTSRSHLLRSLSYDLRSAVRTDFLLTILKTFLNPGTVQRFRRNRPDNRFS